MKLYLDDDSVDSAFVLALLLKKFETRAYWLSAKHWARME